MPFNANFDSPVLIRGEHLRLNGTTEEDQREPLARDGLQLVSRHVALQQGAKVIHGPADFNLNWRAEPPLPASGFTAGDALAVGTEMYFMERPARFLTLTWSQIVAIKEA